MSVADMGETLLQQLEDTVFSEFNVTIPSNYDSPSDVFADDEFFHPEVIHDDETCKWILYYRISHIEIKLWDLLIFVPTSIFLSVLLFNFQKTRQRIGSLVNKKSVNVLYMSIILMVSIGILRCLLNFVIQIELNKPSQAEKVLWSCTHFFYLVTELVIATTILAFEYIGKKGITRAIMASALVSFILSGIKLFLELRHPYYGNKVIKNGHDLYGHGGPLYWSVTSGMLSLTYLLSLCLPVACMKTMIPRATLFYIYLGSQLMLNMLTFLGTLLLIHNNHSGMCITDLTTFCYFSSLPPLAYYCLVRPSLKLSRPNLLFSYSTQVDDQQEDSTLSCTTSAQSFVETPPESTIIKQTALDSSVFSAGIQSPDSLDDRYLLIQ